jgi:methionyl-tRNA synthetase
MPDAPARTLVTSALPYANGPIHLGHLAGAYLPADLYVRYLRLKGEDVVYVCGSDEHGVAILMRAQQEGTSPRDVIDRYHPVIEQGLRQAGISFDQYSRTSLPVHFETAQDFFRALWKGGHLTTRTEEQLYDPHAGLFLADRFVKGTCPSCGYEEAYGDQCERCGTSLSPRELIDPRSTLSDATPILRETTHWYLPLGELQPQLERFISAHPEWKPNVLGQVRSWLASGLRDRAITRDIPWGVPVPDDVAREAGVDATGKVLYVWFDAPIGYVSATRAWADERGDPDAWKPYWQDDRTRLVHFIGKDNIVFHCLIFPGMLLLRGEPWITPSDVPANEFLNLEGQKFSTSRGHALWLHDVLERIDADRLRYGLGASLPETKDADFNLSEFQQRVNGELADVLGNFVNRALTFATRRMDGVVPPLGTPTPDAQAALDALASAPALIGGHYAAFRNREALFATIDLARTGNKFFNDAAPWHQIKTDPAAAGSTIHVALQLCASLSILLEPVVPDAAARLRAMLGLSGLRSSTPNADPGATLGWDDAARPLLSPGYALGEPHVLFEKLPDEWVEAERERLGAPPPAAQPDAAPYAPVASEVAYDDFAKLDLRVGVVTLAEPVPKADRLLRLEVDLGFERRQILSGLAEHFTPDEVVGRKVVVVANLAPRTMRGLESQGMILMAEDREGALHFAAAEGEPGSMVR